MLKGYLYLALAIAGEVSATTALKLSEEFTRPLPTAVVVAGYAAALFYLSLTLRTIPVAVAYAIWAGAGTALIALFGYLVHRQTLDSRAIAGMMLIVAGVALVNGSSSSALR